LFLGSISIVYGTKLSARAGDSFDKCQKCINEMLKREIWPGRQQDIYIQLTDWLVTYTNLLRIRLRVSWEMPR
jgi:hypothetical protein